MGGWKKVPVMKVNYFGMGMYISQGEHIVCLKYHTPYLRVGLIIMATGAISCCIVLKILQRMPVRLTFFAI